MATKYVKFLRGTPKAYEKLTVKDSDTLYFIAETESADGVLYLGSKRIGGIGDLSVASIDELRDVLINENLLDNSFLVYDAVQQQWINKSFEELFPLFQGATADLPGVPGLVPAPLAGITNRFLRSDGKWATIESDGTSGLIQGVSSEFFIDEQGILYLKSIPQDVTLKNNLEFQNLEKQVTSLDTLLISATETIKSNSSSILLLEQKISGENGLNSQIATLSESLLTFKNGVGDLSQLIRTSGNPDSTLVDEVNSLSQRFKWQEL